MTKSKVSIENPRQRVVQRITSDFIITERLVNRLVSYAKDRCSEMGFEFVLNWKMEVTTYNGDVPPADRLYCVSFSNDKGGRIDVAGIQTSNGWPIMDFGFSITDRAPVPEIVQAYESPEI